ncbi:NUDIX domain-containing protein [Herbaspirillum lusitanum]|jgi:8-oxo-dGTP pyrophosphatase MutT (NUDIX family)|uniref:NUDIX domain-containing protein n=1 Tax=Herbaspirillum lusitanum TaxID=213312 RepID=A0ABW9AAZ2_9BURK
MRTRPSSRLLIRDTEGRVLLFRFHHREGALAGQDYWATPGGGVDPGETYEQAACRELREETGLQTNHPGPVVAQREFILQLPDGEHVLAQERFFAVKMEDRCTTGTLSDQGWTEQEKQVIAAHRWWSREELANADFSYFPEDLLSILASLDD